MEHKSSRVAGFKVLDQSAGIVRTLVSVTGVVDEVKDLIRPGAYAKTLVARNPKGVWCADDQTEILTRRGWLRHDQVTTDDEAYALDVERMVARFEPITAVNVFPAEPRRLRRVEAGGFSSLTTMDHRWPVRRPTTAGGGGYRITWQTTAQLGMRTGIVRSRPNDDAPEVPKYADAFVEVVAWVWNGGWFERQGTGTLRASIVQSAAKNPAKCAAIRSAVTKAFPGGWFEKPGAAERGMQVLVLNRDAAEAVAAVCGQDKAPTPEFLTSLTRSQLLLLVQVCIDADGHAEEGGATRWTQVSRHSVGMFEMACALAGIPTNARPKFASANRHGRPATQVTLLKRPFAKPFDAACMSRWSGGGQRVVDEVVCHDGIVWCPTTPSGTWLARRNGSVYFTGNSHNWDEPVSKTLEAKELMPGDPELPELLPNGDPWPADAGGLLVTTQFNLGAPRGQQAFSDVEFYGAEQEWSIGYEVPVGTSKVDPKTGVRDLKEIDLYEYSPVLWGAMPLARTMASKELDHEPVREAQEAVKALRAESGTAPHPFDPAPESESCRACGQPDGTKGHVAPEPEVKKAIAAHSTGTSDKAWDGPAAWKALPNTAAALRAATAWVDPEGDAAAKASYKFVHHFVGSDGAVGAASTKGASFGIGVLNGARSGTTIPDADRKGVYAHLARHLKDAGMTAPALKDAGGGDEAKELAPEEAGVLAPPADVQRQIDVDGPSAYTIVTDGEKFIVTAGGRTVEGGAHKTAEAAAAHVAALNAVNTASAALGDRAAAVAKELLPSFVSSSPDGSNVAVSVDAEGLAKALAERMAAESKAFVVTAAGSYEERQAELADAIQEWLVEQQGPFARYGYPSTYCCVEATFDATVVWSVTTYGKESSEVTFWQAPYTFDAGEATLGDAVEVSVGADISEKAVATALEAKARGWAAASILTRGGAAVVGAGEAKVGRVLSSSNRTAVMGAVEALLGILDAAGVDHGYVRKPADGGVEPAKPAGKAGDVQVDRVTIDPAVLDKARRFKLIG